MQEITLKCDFCRNPVPGGDSVEVRIDNKLYDLCSDCSGKLMKIIRGTGRPVPEPVTQDPLDWSKFSGPGLNELVPLIGRPNLPYSGQPSTLPWVFPSTGVWMNVGENLQGVQAPSTVTFTTSTSDSSVESTVEPGPEVLSSQMALLNSIFLPATSYVGQLDAV